MRKITASLIGISLALVLSSCGYDGHYRYECQDPANWNSAECNPPTCEATGTCSRDLVGKETWAEYEKNKVNNG
jgi:hypothetical protein